MTEPDRTPNAAADAWIRAHGHRSVTFRQDPGESLDQAIRRASGRLSAEVTPPVTPDPTQEAA